MIKTIIIGYLIFMSLFSFLLWGTDKQKARHCRWRIRESRLLLSALLGGSPGALLGIYVFRHKTLHLKFTLGIPIILLLQIGLILGYLYLF